MCGICGCISLNSAPIDVAVSRRMLSVLNHRGPDSSGQEFGENYFLGHTRLSILDAEGGAQPMCNRAGLWIVFNGEIYNYREIRRVLEKKGVVFHTRSDTEVVLQAYSMWGTKCVDKFSGMFALVILDIQKNCLFLARDRFGKKPLYYFYEDNTFLFGSEIKALLQHPLVREKIEIDNASLVDYLSIGYILSPKTIFQKIRQLPQASYAVLDFVSREFTDRRYWSYKNDFDDFGGQQSTQSSDQVFSETLSAAVKARMNADVPVGTYLSGGIDSTTVTALANQFSNHNPRAFCIGFEEESFDESMEAKRISASLGIDLSVGVYKPVSRDMMSKIVWHFDQPFSDNSAYPTYQLNQFAGQYGKVMLSGDGADEILAGYPTYQADMLFPAYRRLPLFAQNALHALSTNLPPSYKKVSFDYKLRQFLSAAGMTPEQAHYWWRVIFSPREIQSILTPEFLSQVGGYSTEMTFLDHFQAVKDLPFLNQALCVDVETWLVDDILVKADRMSMAHSVEVRSPFLDNDLVKLASQLPVSKKMSLLRGKKILRDLMTSRFPSVRIGRKKKGFNSPPIHQQVGRLPSDQMFATDFHLSTHKEDVTFKKNNLLVLMLWFDIYTAYKKTGYWEPQTYGY